MKNLRKDSKAIIELENGPLMATSDFGMANRSDNANESTNLASSIFLAQGRRALGDFKDKGTTLLALDVRMARRELTTILGFLSSIRNPTSSIRERVIQFVLWVKRSRPCQARMHKITRNQARIYILLRWSND
eukprot:Gb_29943 [translate_table: standard]